MQRAQGLGATIVLSSLVLVVFVALADAHGGVHMNNPQLGVPGYPDCKQTVLPVPSTVEEADASLVCHQRPKDFAAQISVACVGDSITAGAHSSDAAHAYPSQLQELLGSGYKVTNLGACGSTMLKGGDSPYWKRSQYEGLVGNKWDIVVIMLGTNDSKDKSSGGPDNWPATCTGAPEDASKCAYVADYRSMIDLVRTLGTTAAGPQIFTMVPPPLMQQGAYGMNETVLNTILPKLVPFINADNKLPHAAIDLFTEFGGKDQASFPQGGCTQSTQEAFKCKYYCDAQSCDQCHPNDAGYAHMAAVVKEAITKTAAAKKIWI